MNRDLAQNTLIGNIFGNIGRLGRNEATISPTSAVLQAQKTNLYNNLMESRDKRLKREDAEAAAEEARLAAVRAKTDPILQAVGAKQLSREAAIPLLDAEDPSGDASKPLKEQIEFENKQTEFENKQTEFNDPNKNLTADQRLFKENRPMWEELNTAEQAGKGPLVSNVFNAGDPKFQDAVVDAAGAFKEDSKNWKPLVDAVALVDPDAAKTLSTTFKNTVATANAEDVGERAAAEEERAEKRRSGATQRDAMGKLMALKGLRQARAVAFKHGLGATGTAAKIASGWGTISEMPYSQIKTHVASMLSDSTFTTLKDIKDSGATLGAISKPELELLMTKYGLLDPGIESEIFLQRADDFETVYTAILDKITPEDAKKHNIPMPEGWWEERASRLMGDSTKEKNKKTVEGYLDRVRRQ